jgi:two-component system sensor histidine kinase ChvG
VQDSERLNGSDVVLGDDWVAPHAVSDSELRAKRGQRGLISINRSPLARKIVTFNLLALIIMVAGVLYLNPFRDSLVFQRERAMVVQAEILADVFEAQATGLRANAAQQADQSGDDTPVVRDIDPFVTLDGLDLPANVEVYIFNLDEKIVASSIGMLRTVLEPATRFQQDTERTLITGFLSAVWQRLSDVLTPGKPDEGPHDTEAQARIMAPGSLAGKTLIDTNRNAEGQVVFTVTTPILSNGSVTGALALTSMGTDIDQMVRNEREQVLQMFVIAVLVSIGLSLVLASTIANPLADLAAAAEIGRDKNSRKVSPGRIRIPDLSGRPDEIGRLSGALRSMVGALYDRIDANEQFAADVAHEIKNPLASLRSAVGTLRVARREDHRDKLLDVIDHDVRRLDRLVSDISNASRLDSELVKEEEETFDLIHMLRNLTDHLGKEASEKGVEFISDLPGKPIEIQGLEARLAQVFVNLITNAISFCEEGDAIRVWARKRDNRVLVVVEDTGPGIPEQALTKIFNRFYSERPVGQFGNNSGLGLAISKQIVEAHGGVIWAENIRPTDADVTSEPLGARFVAGLPV